MERQLEQLAAIMKTQAEMAQQREDRLTALLEGLTGDGRNSSAAAANAEGQSRAKVPHSVAPAPHLSSSVSLKEFDAWRHKFEGYATLTGIRLLTPAEQRSALTSLLDEDWTRTLRYGLQVEEGADLKQILDAMETHLRNQRNIIVDRREFHLRTQDVGESFDDFLCRIKEIAAFCDFCPDFSIMGGPVAPSCQLVVPVTPGIQLS